MYEQGGDPDFWWKLILLLIIFSVAWIIFAAIVRRMLKVEKQNFFSVYHVNDRHKKVDRFISLIAIVGIIGGYAVNSMRNPSEWFWFLEPWFIMLLFLGCTQIAKVIMEHKYADNSNRYKVTISETVFIIIIFLSLYVTDFWGLG